MVTWSKTNGACCGVCVGRGLCWSRTLPLRDLDFFDTGVSDLPLRLGVISLYDPFSRSWEVSMVGSKGGEDICMARTDSGFRKRGRSFRGVYRVSSVSLACGMGLVAIELSDGMAETRLYCVTPDERRGCELDLREVYELLYGCGPSSSSMLGIASSAVGTESSELNDMSSSSDSDGDDASCSSGSS